MRPVRTPVSLWCESRREATGVMQTTRVTIDIDVGSDPISGHVDVAGTPTETFVGWSALAQLLEEARTGNEAPEAEGETPCGD